MPMSTRLAPGLLRRARSALAACLVTGLAASSTHRHPARAEPLPKEACDLLGEEHQRLSSGGVREWMAAGAATARSRLSGEQLKSIERFIEVDEQLAFRCGQFKARFVLPRDPEEPPEPEPAKATEERKPKKAKKVGEAKTEASDGERASEAKPASAAEKPAPRRKPKADDAYRPADAGARH